MDKKLFLGNLDKLNKVALNLAKDFLEEIGYNALLGLMNEMKCSKYPSKEKIRKKFEYDSIILDGHEFPCGLDCDSFSIYK